MTPLEFVERERVRLRRLHVIAGASLALAITFTALALAALFFGNARWIALPRSAPFAVWIHIAILDAAVIVWSDGPKMYFFASGQMNLAELLPIARRVYDR